MQRYREKQKDTERRYGEKLKRSAGSYKMEFAEQRTRAWSSERLKELYVLRYDMGLTYDELQKRFNRTSEDIVNALSTIRLRRQGGQDPFEQIGSDKGVREAEEYEKRRAKYTAKYIKGGQ